MKITVYRSPEPRNSLRAVSLWTVIKPVATVERNISALTSVMRLLDNDDQPLVVQHNGCIFHLSDFLADYSHA